MANTNPIVSVTSTGEAKTLDPSSDVLSVGTIDANYHPIKNVSSPVDPDDVATKSYVDSAAGVIPSHNALLGRSDADAHPMSSITGLTNALGGKAASVHSHSIGDLPVPSLGGTASSSQVVRGDDPRLSNARAPTAHSHTISEVTNLQNALDGKAAISHGHSIGDLPVATSGTSDSTKLVRADDSRLSDTRTPKAHSHAIGDLPVPAAGGTASSTQVVRGDDPRLSDARTPKAHSHAIGDLPVPAAGGSASSSQVVRGDDPRLSNARAPTAHSHAIADVTNLQNALDSKALASHTHAILDLPVATSGTSDPTKLVRSDDSRLSDSRTPKTHSHAIGDLPVPAAGNTATSNQVVRGDDPRLSNARAPTAHSHTIGDVSGLTAALDSKVDGSKAISEATFAPGLLFYGDLGSGMFLNVYWANDGEASEYKVPRSNDSRLSDARTPKAHTHAISDITNLQTTLNGKASTSHTHDHSFLSSAGSRTHSEIDEHLRNNEKQDEKYWVSTDWQHALLRASQYEAIRKDEKENEVVAPELSTYFLPESLVYYKANKLFDPKDDLSKGQASILAADPTDKTNLGLVHEIGFDGEENSVESGPRLKYRWGLKSTGGWDVWRKIPIEGDYVTPFDARLTNARTPLPHDHSGDAWFTESLSGMLSGYVTSSAFSAGLNNIAGRSILAGTGLTGGGSLFADRTLSVNFASSGVTSSTQAVRADDLRLSNARTPTSHSHTINDLPVAADGVSDSTKLVRSNDSRLNTWRTIAHFSALPASGTLSTTPTPMTETTMLVDLRGATRFRFSWLYSAKTGTVMVRPQYALGGPGATYTDIGTGTNLILSPYGQAVGGTIPVDAQVESCWLRLSLYMASGSGSVTLSQFKIEVM